MPLLASMQQRRAVVAGVLVTCLSFAAPATLGSKAWHGAEAGLAGILEISTPGAIAAGAAFADSRPKRSADSGNDLPTDLAVGPHTPRETGEWPPSALHSFNDDVPQNLFPRALPIRAPPCQTASLTLLEQFTELLQTCRCTGRGNGCSSDDKEVPWVRSIRLLPMATGAEGGGSGIRFAS